MNNKTDNTYANTDSYKYSSDLSKKFMNSSHKLGETADIQLYGCRFLGIDNKWKDTPRAIFYIRGGLATKYIEEDRTIYHDKEICISMDNLLELNNQIKLYEAKKTGIVKTILDYMDKDIDIIDIIDIYEYNDEAAYNEGTPYKTTKFYPDDMKNDNTLLLIADRFRYFNVRSLSINCKRLVIDVIDELGDR